MLSEKIKKYRADNNLTQEEFAAKLFVTRNAVSKWENDNGYPNIDTLKDIAKLLNITIDELLGEDDVKTIAINANEKLNKYKNYNLSVLENYSCREVLGFIAGVLGANAIINREGKISILGLKQYQENIYAPKFWALDY